PISTLLPYTTLFLSAHLVESLRDDERRAAVVQQPGQQLRQEPDRQEYPGECEKKRAAYDPNTGGPCQRRGTHDGHQRSCTAEQRSEEHTSELQSRVD